MLNKRIHTGDLIPPIQSLEDYFREGGVSIIQAAFAHSYFVHPDNVRERTPYYPERARRSLEHYPGRGKGQSAVWDSGGQRRDVILDDNSRAQMAWEKYTGRKLARGTGYGVRHIWGNPWNPDAFTAGWNICYMPFWAGMLTEEQHPHPELEWAIRQASWELFFQDNRVCQPPEFIENPGLDLDKILADQPLLILSKATQSNKTPLNPPVPDSSRAPAEIWEQVKEIRSEQRQSWSNIGKAANDLQGKNHEPFGTDNVAASAKSCVRKILRETGLTYGQLETLLSENGFC